MYFRFFFFGEFVDDVRFLENRNNVFEENSLKALLRQSFRVFDFSNLSSDSRYLESVTLKALGCYSQRSLYVVTAAQWTQALHVVGRTLSICQS